MYFNAIRENKILAKISGLTVYNRLKLCNVNPNALYQELHVADNILKKFPPNLGAAKLPLILVKQFTALESILTGKRNATSKICDKLLKRKK